MKLPTAFLALSLLFVGAGCAATQEIQLDAGSNADEQTRPQETGVNAEINAVVDGILESSEGEEAELRHEEETAGEVTKDSAELNAYSESNYEIE